MKIAIFDTGFCIHYSDVKKANLIVKKYHPKFSLSITTPHFSMDQFKIECDKASPTNFINTRNQRLHGQKVLNTILDSFLKLISQNQKSMLNSHSQFQRLEIHPIIIFDHDGIQKMEYWENALLHLKTQKISHVISASLLPIHQESEFPKLSLLANELINKQNLQLILASGRKEFSIKNLKGFFPTDFLQPENMLIVGSQEVIKVGRIVKNIPDPDTYRPEYVDIWIDENPEIRFNGSSHGVSIYGGHFLFEKIFLKKMGKIENQNSGLQKKKSNDRNANVNVD